MNFKVGDLVRCINPGNGFILTKDSLYTIKKINNDTKIGFVYLEEMNADIGFFAHRFEKVEYTVCQTGRIASGDLVYKINFEPPKKVDHMALVRQIALEWRE